ncbi:MAG: hypothetical protein ACPG4X_21245 [Pikeienuella sp.]
MAELTDRDFLAAKAKLDKAIKSVGRLADDAFEASMTCCANGDLDQRDQFGDVSGHLRAAQASLTLARAAAGRIEGGGITRSGGT